MLVEMILQTNIVITLKEVECNKIVQMLWKGKIITKIIHWRGLLKLLLLLLSPEAYHSHANHLSISETRQNLHYFTVFLCAVRM